METILYALIGLVARIHNDIMTWNDASHGFTDKELHFLVIGVVGIALVFIVHPIFKWLAKTGHTMVITFLYAFTVMLVLTFAIEIGQKVTGTGAMEFADIVYGIAGFLLLFVIFIILRAIFHAIVNVIKKRSTNRNHNKHRY